MKFIFVALLAFAAVHTHAFTTPLEPVIPFEPVVLSEPDTDLKRTYLGTLEGYPDMVEFSVFASTTVALQIWQAETETPTPFGVIVVRVNEDGRGVTEVARAQQEGVVWETTSIDMLGQSLTTSETVEITLAAGQYRVEVSTPDNIGEYALLFNPDAPHGYFETLQGIFAVNQHFSLGTFAMLRSPYVLYPFGLVIVVIGIALTWRFRHRISHAA